MEKICNNGIEQLLADKGYMITNGTDIYCYDLTLEEGGDSSLYYEITIEEYEQILAERAKEESEYVLSE